MVVFVVVSNLLLSTLLHVSVGLLGGSCIVVAVGSVIDRVIVMIH